MQGLLGENKVMIKLGVNSWTEGSCIAWPKGTAAAATNIEVKAPP